MSPGRPTASEEGRIDPQPFTTSVGTSARGLVFGIVAEEPSGRRKGAHGRAQPRMLARRFELPMLIAALLVISFRPMARAFSRRKGDFEEALSATWKGR